LSRLFPTQMNDTQFNELFLVSSSPKWYLKSHPGTLSTTFVSGGVLVAAYRHGEDEREVTGRFGAVRADRARYCTHGPYRAATFRPGLAHPLRHSRAATSYPARGES